MDASISISAEASSGSRNPADRPTATQLFCQKRARCPASMLMRRADSPWAAVPTWRRSAASAASSLICALL